MYKPLIFQKFLFILLDILLIVLAFVLAFFLRLGSFYRSDFPFSVYISTALLIVPAWIFLLAWGGKYRLQEKKLSSLLRSISLASLGGTMLFVLIFFFRREVFFSRLIVLYIFTFGTFLGLLSVWIERMFQKYQSEAQKNIRRVLIIGANRTAEEMIANMQRRKSREQAVAILAPFGSSRKEISGVPVLGKLDALERITIQENIDHILVCDASEQLLNLLAFAEGHFLEFTIAPELIGMYRDNIEPKMLAGKTVVSLQSSPLLGWPQVWKRAFDILLALLLLIILLPVFGIQKILRGSQKLLVREERIGAGGQPFSLWRYAKTSSFFRDLPNILNILTGEMSFVGPRPALPEEWKSLPAHFRRKLILRPGMLGPWQLQKLKGTPDDQTQMYKYDLSYIHTWSFWKDLKILVASIGAIISNKKEPLSTSQE